MIASFAVLDVEASALSLSNWPELSSYPIEVGVALVDPQETITSWSTLIKPDRRWLARGDWDPRSERVHQLTRAMVETGEEVGIVAASLNAVLAPLGRVVCDGGRYDAHWLSVLHATAGVAPTYRLGSVDELLDTEAARTGYAANLAQSRAPHRAAADAERIARAILAARNSGG